MSSDDDSNDNLPLVAQLLAAEERNKAAIFRKALDTRPKATIQKRIDSETNKVRKETYFDRGRLYQHLMSSEMKKNGCL
jgi:hypothetical protein